MKKILVILAASMPSLSYGAVGTGNLTQEARGETICVPRYTDTSSAAVGTDGALFGTSVANVTSVSGTSFAPVAFPSKIAYQLIDAGTNAASTTLACTSITIRGENQFGEAVTHTDSTLTESQEYTSQAFAVVTSVSASGCTGALDGGDRLRLASSRHIGLTRKVKSFQDVEALCIADASDSSNLKCAFGNDGSSADLQSLLNVAAATIDVQTTAIFGATKVAAAEGDQICWRVRPSF